jgi:hypothetical protein
MSAVRPDFSRFLCQDYLESRYFDVGYYSEKNHCWLVLPKESATDLCDLDGRPLRFLKIGDPQADGVSFGYREGEMGVWSHEPILDEFLLVANDVHELVALFESGRLLQW